MNITSLYIVILNDDGPRALDQRTVKEPSSKTLRRPAKQVLTLNCFSFGGNYYKITDGVALATKVGPSYANLPVGFIENHFLVKTSAPNLNSTAVTLTTLSGLPPLLGRSSLNL